MDLKRAADIMRGMGPPFQAVMSLLAEAHHQDGDYTMAQESLQELLQSLDKESETTAYVQLALAKVLWYNGDFSNASSMAETVLEGVDENSNGTLYHCATNAHRLSTLLTSSSSSTTDDELVDTSPPDDPPLLAPALLNNEGIVRILSERGTMDDAMQLWQRGLQHLDGADDESSQRTKSLQSRIRVNMIWSLLSDMSGDEDSLAVASDHAREALQLVEGGGDKRGLHRALLAVAMCYRRAKSAVTAEGLLQTVLGDATVTDSLQLLVRRDALMQYSELCHDWDKREKEGDQLEAQAHEVVLPGDWKNQPGMLSGLWFFTPDEIS